MWNWSADFDCAYWMPEIPKPVALQGVNGTSIFTQLPEVTEVIVGKLIAKMDDGVRVYSSSSFEVLT